MAAKIILENHFVEGEEKQLLENMIQLHDKYNSLMASFFDFYKNNPDNLEGLKNKKIEIDFAGDDLLKSHDSLLLIAENEIKELKDSADENIIVSRNIILFSSIFIVILAIVLGLLISHSISKPIEKLTKTIEEISTGKLDVEIGPKLKESKDEIGRLARAFDRTAVSLKLAMRKGKKK